MTIRTPLLLAAGLLAVLAFLMLKMKWYAQVPLFLAGLGGVTCVYLGQEKLTDNFVETDTVGIILIVSGSLILLGVGVVVKLLFGVHKETGRKADTGDV